MSDDINNAQLVKIAEKLEGILSELDSMNAQVPAIKIDAAIVELYQACGLDRADSSNSDD